MNRRQRRAYARGMRMTIASTQPHVTREIKERKRKQKAKNRKANRLARKQRARNVDED